MFVVCRRILLLALVCSAVPALSASAPLIVLEDPRGDDNGPGTYVPPSGSEFRPGDFDLRRFAVRVEGQEAVIEVTLGAKLRREIVRERTNAADLDLPNGIYVQNVDIYVDTTPGAGFTEGLPGRRIVFSPESAWDVAIAITPRPGPTRSILNGWNFEAAQKVATPGPVRTSGPTLTVRVPLAQLGGIPQTNWGWSVMVSGASWERSFAAVDRVAGWHQADAFTLPVYAVPEEYAFGGGRLNGGHPYVIDVILPEGKSQSQVLGRFAPGSPAVIPMVYPDPARARQVEAEHARAAGASVPSKQGTGQVEGLMAPKLNVPGESGGAQSKAGFASDLAPKDEPQPTASEQSFTIASIQGDTAVIPTPGGSAVTAWQMGNVVDADGRQQGRVVVTTVSDRFVVATVIDGKGTVNVGHRVRFPPLPATSK